MIELNAKERRVCSLFVRICFHDDMREIDQSQGTVSIISFRAVKHVNSKYEMMATDVVLFMDL